MNLQLIIVFYSKSRLFKTPFVITYTGTSDPYVKFVWGKSTTEAAKSTVVKENCDPIWDEEFNITVDNISMGLLVRVYTIRYRNPLLINAFSFISSGFRSRLGE